MEINEFPININGWANGERMIEMSYDQDRSLSRNLKMTITMCNRAIVDVAR